MDLTPFGRQPGGPEEFDSEPIPAISSPLVPCEHSRGAPPSFFPGVDASSPVPGLTERNHSMSIEIPTRSIVGTLEYMLVEILDDLEQPDTVARAVAMFSTPGLAIERAKSLLRRPMPAGFGWRWMEIREGRWIDGMEGPAFCEEDFRVWFLQIGFQGEVLLRESGKP
jgi:hypothetical protein